MWSSSRQKGCSMRNCHKKTEVDRIYHSGCAAGGVLHSLLFVVGRVSGVCLHERILRAGSLKSWRLPARLQPSGALLCLCGPSGDVKTRGCRFRTYPRCEARIGNPRGQQHRVRCHNPEVEAVHVIDHFAADDGLATCNEGDGLVSLDCHNAHLVQLDPADKVCACCRYVEDVLEEDGMELVVV